MSKVLRRWFARLLNVIDIDIVENMAFHLPDTETPDILSLTPTTSANILAPTKPWGRLYSTYLYLEPVDLEQATFMLGRSEDCDVIINDSKIPINRVTNISKRHFSITKEENLIYIEDMSKNGTFLNGTRIGKGCKHILQNDDEIAIGFKGLKVYIFKTLGSDNDNYLPPELQRKYQISRVLGVGACAEVRLAFNKITCLPFAVKKIIKGKKSNNACNLLNHPDKIKAEIKILKALSHPCIIKMEEIVETEDCVFIILEYMEGGELSDLICSARRLSETQTKYLFYQIVLAVQYLHGMDVTHRDLKPQNVLLKKHDSNTIVKISDFGLSKILEEDTIMNTICGTPNYVAPEVIDKTVSVYTKKVDIWSLGVILYYMLSQELPFSSPNCAVLNKQIMTGSFTYNKDSWEGISEQSKDLINKMLTVDPEKRISMEDIIAHPWISEDWGVRQRVTDLLYSEFQTEILTSGSEDTYSPPAKMSRHSDSSTF